MVLFFKLSAYPFFIILGFMTSVSNHYFLVLGIKIETFWTIYSGPTQKKPFSPLGGLVFFFFFF